jgi:hypothetical protein
VLETDIEAIFLAERPLYRAEQVLVTGNGAPATPTGKMVMMPLLSVMVDETAT